MNDCDLLLPPSHEVTFTVWAKIYVDDEGYSEVTDRAGIAIEQFDCYAHALEFVRYNKMQLKTVHRVCGDGSSTFLHLVGE
jgi:hypothetical protein